jgi:hypothetical protein
MKKKDELLQQNDNINSLENSLKKSRQELSRLISYKDREREEQFEFKDQQRFVERQRKKSRMDDEEFARK